MIDITKSIDHLVWGCSDLDDAVRHIEELTGVRPAFGGRHSSGGTMNALMALGSRTYLEIIAPDPLADDHGEWAHSLAALERPKPFALCVAVSVGLSALQARAVEAGLHAEIEKGGRVRPDGVALHWELFEPVNHALGCALPFFIDWHDSPHPAHGAPQGVTLTNLKITHPDPALVKDTLAALGMSAPVVVADHPGFCATLSTATGTITLS
jgi:hypothetical protein